MTSIKRRKSKVCFCVDETKEEQFTPRFTKSVCSTDSSTAHANLEAVSQVYTLQKIMLFWDQHKLESAQQS